MSLGFCKLQSHKVPANKDAGPFHLSPPPANSKTLWRGQRITPAVPRINKERWQQSLRANQTGVSDSVQCIHGIEDFSFLRKNTIHWEAFLLKKPFLGSRLHIPPQNWRPGSKAFVHATCQPHNWMWWKNCPALPRLRHCHLWGEAWFFVPLTTSLALILNCSLVCSPLKGPR